MAKTTRKNNLKIQILAGNTLMSRFHVGFEIELPLIIISIVEMFLELDLLNLFMRVLMVIIFCFDQ